MQTIAITEKDLLREENRWREVINGVWVEKMSPSILHTFILKNIFRLLDDFASQHDLGYVFPDGLHYRLREAGDVLHDARIPDTSFVKKERLPADFKLDRVFPGAPDLAVEIASSSESESSLVEKMHDYMAAGTEEVWILYPSVNELYRYHRDNLKHIRVYGEEDILDNVVLLPDFKLKIADCFALPQVD